VDLFSLLLRSRLHIPVLRKSTSCRARKNSLFGISSAMLFLTRSNDIKEPHPMEWTTPKHEEIDLNCEISSYANAEL